MSGQFQEKEINYGYKEPASGTSDGFFGFSVSSAPLLSFVDKNYGYATGNAKTDASEYDYVSPNGIIMKHTSRSQANSIKTCKDDLTGFIPLSDCYCKQGTEDIKCNNGGAVLVAGVLAIMALLL